MRTFFYVYTKNIDPEICRKYLKKDNLLRGRFAYDATKIMISELHDTPYIFACMRAYIVIVTLTFSSARYTLYARDRRDGYEKLYRATDRDSLMRLWTKQGRSERIEKAWSTADAEGRDCSRLINARVSLTSARQKSSAACLPIESSRRTGAAWRRAGAWKQFLARRVHIVPPSAE